ncbi:MAG: hypothetical protein HY746_10655 [Elusimicrobia bacterium]|nr:hypothetical protein [Elusimicrobiota bacterium]
MAEEPNKRESESRKIFLLKLIAVIFGAIFVLLCVIVFMMYRNIREMKTGFDDSYETTAAWNEIQNAMPEIAKINFSTHAPGSSLTTFKDSGLMAGPGIEKIDTDKVYKSIAKYSDRPVVREFMEDLKADPDFKKVLDARDSGDPQKIFANVGKVKNLNKILAKYIYRPDFIKLMMEVYSDPELQPMLQKFGAGALPLNPQAMQKKDANRRSSESSLPKVNPVRDSPP